MRVPFVYTPLQLLTDRGRCCIAEELGCSDAQVALADNATQGERVCFIIFNISLLIKAVGFRFSPSLQASAQSYSMRLFSPSWPIV
jgi:hypothetical protein